MTAAEPQFRIAIVTDAIYPHHKGGKEIRYHELALGLAARGHMVDVYTMRWWARAPESCAGKPTYHALSRLIPLYQGERRSIWQAIVFSFGCLRLIGRRFDLIEADHMPYLPLFPLRVVAWIHRRPLVVTWHEVWGAKYWREYLGPLGFVAAFIETLSMRLPDHIVAASQETGRRLRVATRGRVPVTVVPNGIDMALLKSISPAAKVSDILFVGRLLEHKGVQHLLMALATLRGRGQHPSCHIVGSGPEAARLHALATNLGLDGQVSFAAGVETQAEVFALMKAATVFAFPSVREGYGIAVAEAIACGTRVVTTDHKDNLARLLIKDSTIGALYTPDDPDALAEALEEVLASTSSVERTDSNFGAEMSWDSRVRQTMRVYESCIQQ